MPGKSNQFPAKGKAKKQFFLNHGFGLIRAKNDLKSAAAGA